MNAIGSLSPGLVLRRCFVRRFTLAEVLVAFGVTAMTLAAAMSLYSVFMYTDDMVTRRSTALSIARSQLDFLRAQPYVDLASANETATKVNGDSEVLETGMFERTTTITAGTNDTYKTVTVTVFSPRQVRRPSVTVTLTTNIMDKSLISNMQ